MLCKDNEDKNVKKECMNMSDDKSEKIVEEKKTLEVSKKEPLKDHGNKSNEIIEEKMEVDAVKEEQKDSAKKLSKKRKNGSKKNEKPNKKRKRIQVMCDSDSGEPGYRK